MGISTAFNLCCQVIKVVSSRNNPTFPSQLGAVNPGNPKQIKPGVPQVMASSMTTSDMKRKKKNIPSRRNQESSFFAMPSWSYSIEVDMCTFLGFYVCFYQWSRLFFSMSWGWQRRSRSLFTGLEATVAVSTRDADGTNDFWDIARQQRWRAVQDRDIIVRVGLGVPLAKLCDEECLLFAFLQVGYQTDTSWYIVIHS